MAFLDLLYQLHSEGIPVALASSADRKVINAVLTKFGLMDCFEYILSGAELPASKPNPAIYQLTAKALGFAPADCVVIEDATAGIMAAKDAGAYCIAYDNPNSGPQDLSRADKIVSSLSDIVVSDILQINLLRFYYGKFKFYCPTEIIFGKDSELSTASLIKNTMVIMY